MKNLIALGMTSVIQTSAVRFFIHTSKKRNKVTFNSYNYFSLRRVGRHIVFAPAVCLSQNHVFVTKIVSVL